VSSNVPEAPLFGPRRKPGRLALAFFRMPLRTFRHDAGWLLGHTFLLLVHTGRRTGQPHSPIGRRPTDLSGSAYLGCRRPLLGTSARCSGRIV
jgi:hypothetical protein